MIKEKKRMIIGEIMLIGTLFLPLIYLIVFFKEILAFTYNPILSLIGFIIFAISTALFLISSSIIIYNSHKMAFEKALE